MSNPIEISFTEEDLSALAEASGAVVVFAGGKDALSAAARAADAATGGAVTRLLRGRDFKAEPGEVGALACPHGMKADMLLVAATGAGAADGLDPGAARRIGGAVGARSAGQDTVIFASGLPDAAAVAEMAFGVALRRYDFDAHKKPAEDRTRGSIAVRAAAPEAVARASAPLAALAEGVFFTRDLVNEPANVLTTDDFAARLAAMEEIGLQVEILGEAELEALGMRTLLAVGRGSPAESKVVTMKWSGGGAEPPLALIGKGVVFDTGGISIKPAAGMEEMTMDMGGAGVVAGVMRTLALRGAKANVVGLVGLVENMPDGMAQRPGDVVRTMKGDTVEVINTDAEGRLVLADVMWHAQQTHRPKAMIDLATLTGAMVIALGHENAGYFANDDDLAAAFQAAADAAGEGAWRMPLGEGYDKLLKSRIADMKNVGGRAAGAISAAQFLQRFVTEGTPWVHIDIAGVATAKEATPLCPVGASGWGVMALDRLVRDRFEG